MKKHPGGRPTDYTPELAQEICDAIACDSKGLRRLCNENEHWPVRTIIYRWLRKHSEFRHLYMQAKENQIESLVDEILDIADNTSQDTIVKFDSDGNEREVCNSEWINRSRLRIDTRKWLAGKLAPKIYGEKVKDVQEDTSSLMQKLIDKL